MNNEASFQSEDSSNESATLNALEGPVDVDVQSISLLRQIFPEEPIGALRRIHDERLKINSKRQQQHNALCGEERQKQGVNFKLSHSRLGNRIRRRLRNEGQEVILPHDFLRLPLHVAVRRYSERDGRWHYELVSEMETHAINRYQQTLSRTHTGNAQYKVFSKIVFPDINFGLGMNLMENFGTIVVHSFIDTRPGVSPAQRCGIQAGDVLVGVNGTAFEESLAHGKSLLQNAAAMLQGSPEPVVLHIIRKIHQENVSHFPCVVTTHSLLDTSDILNENSSIVEDSFDGDKFFPSTPLAAIDDCIHPIAEELIRLSLLNPGKDAENTTRTLLQYTERCRQWEASTMFLVPDSLVDQYGGDHISLHGVRQALSVRIVDSFVDGDGPAYTIWIYDVESGSEWHAPVRHLKDFIDLRTVMLPLLSAISKFPFPKKTGLSLFGSPMRDDIQSDYDNRYRLESFLRSLAAIPYREKIDPCIPEVAIHLQTFLGCDSNLSFASFLDEGKGHLPKGLQMHLGLKCAIQRYVHRLLLLPIMVSLIENFVNSFRPPKRLEIEKLEVDGRAILKEKAESELKKVQSFLDHLQGIIMQGCYRDLKAIATRKEYETLHDSLFGSGEGDFEWDRLLRESIRQQIEVEVYVPLRSILSKWIVSGWKHEGMFNKQQ